MAFACFRPSHVPSKKAIILSLEGSRERLEQDNLRLKQRADTLQLQNKQLTAERDRCDSLCRDLQQSLQRSTLNAAEAYSRCEQLRQGISQVLLGKTVLPVVSAASHRHLLGPHDTIARVSVSCEDEPGSHDDPDCDVANMEPHGFEPEHPHLQLQAALASLSEELAALLDQHRHAIQQLADAHSMGKDLQQQLVQAQHARDSAIADGKALVELAQLRCTALEGESVGQAEIIRQLEAQLAAAHAAHSSVAVQHHAESGRLVGVQAMLAAETNERMALEDELKVAQEALQVMEQEATARAQQLTQLLAVKVQLDAATTQLADTENEVAELRAELAAAQLAAAASAGALTAARSALPPLQQRARAAEASAAASAAELLAVRGTLTAKQAELAARGSELARAQRNLQEASQRVEVVEQQLNETSARLSNTQVQLREAQAAHLATRQQLAGTAKQLAVTAAEMGTSLGTSRTYEDELNATKQRLQEATAQLAASREHVTAVSGRLAAFESNSAAVEAELRSLSTTYDRTAAELERKRMLLLAISRIANKGKVAQDEDAIQHYKAAVAEEGLVVKLCEAPLGLLSSMAAGIVDSRQLSHLKLDLDAARENTWEKAGLRIACLAAALSLNGSLQSLELVGWTWDEVGNGSASPFLMLSGPASALTTVRIDTRLFDVESAAVLRDLLVRGLIELKRDKGQGVLRLYGPGERLDEWYCAMVRRSVPVATPPLSRKSSMGHGSTHALSPRGTASIGGAGSTESSAAAAVVAVSGNGQVPSLHHNGLCRLSGSSACSASSAMTGLSGTSGAQHAQMPSTGGTSSTGGNVNAVSGEGRGVWLPPPPSPFGGSLGLPAFTTAHVPLPHHAASASGQSMASSLNDRPLTAGLHQRNMSRAASLAGEPRCSQGNIAPGGSGPVDCDLSNEGLESHHMVLVMAILLVCPQLRRLKLEGNKIGDPGAEILALALPHNSTMLELGLARNTIRAKGAKKLSRGLECNSALRRLDVSDQRFGGLGPQGAEALASSLRVNTALEELNISSNHIAAAGASALAAALRGAGSSSALRRLHVGDNKLDANALRLLQAVAHDRKPNLIIINT